MNLTLKDYKRILSSSMSMEEKHRRLIGNSCNERDIADCGVSYVSNLLKADMGRSEPYVFSENTMNFFRSTHLSNYFKNSIKILLKEEELDEFTLKTLNSEKDINDMSAEEIKALFDAIANYNRKENREYAPNISYSFGNYLFKLDGNGPTSYIKNNISGYKIAEHIMYTSGIGSVRPDFYSGRGVKKCDLDYLQLVEIFLKLIVLDKKYAIAFANMVLSIKTLGATEFMESFYNLGRNNFVFEQETISNKNNSLNSTPQERLSSQAVAVVANVLGNKQEESVDISLTESMKRSFIEEIKELLDTIDPNFDYGDYSPSGYESFGWGKPHMRLR